MRLQALACDHARDAFARQRPHGAQDPRVRAATAQMGLQGLLDRPFVRLWSGSQQCRRRNDHARNAISALRRTSLDELCTDPLHNRIVGGLDSFDLPARELTGRRIATQNRKRRRPAPRTRRTAQGRSRASCRSVPTRCAGHRRAASMDRNRTSWETPFTRSDNMSAMLAQRLRSIAAS